MFKILSLVSISIICIQLNAADNLVDQCFQVSGDMIVDYDATCGSEVIVPAQINNKEIKSIGFRAFKKKNLTKVQISEGIQWIAHQAFIWNEIQSLELPNSITKISDQAFLANKLQSITIPGSLKIISQQVFAENQLEEIIIEEGIRKIHLGAFEDNIIRNIVLPKSMESLSARAFLGNPIEEIIIHGEVVTYDSQPPFHNSYQLATDYGVSSYPWYRVFKGTYSFQDGKWFRN